MALSQTNRNAAAGSRHVLVVDDERDILDLVSFNLRRAGYEVATASSGLQAMRALAARTPDLVILDLMLPEISGLEIASRIRTDPTTAHIPIIMLTAKSQESDQVAGLAIGADDYVTKPFSVRVLAARVEAHLRRTTPAREVERGLRAGAIEIDTGRHQVRIGGEVARFTLTEYRILTALVQAGGRVLTRAALMTRAMGPGVTVTERTIDVHVTAIRKRLREHAWMLKTVRGVGYRISEEPESGAG